MHKKNEVESKVKLNLTISTVLSSLNENVLKWAKMSLTPGEGNDHCHSRYHYNPILPSNTHKLFVSAVTNK